MDPNDQNQPGPTDTPQGPVSDNDQGIPGGVGEPQMPPSSPPTEGQEEEELPPPPPVETPSDVPAGDSGSVPTA